MRRTRSTHLERLRRGIDAAVPVDLTIRGCPPTPAQLLDGLRSLLEANARG